MPGASGPARLPRPGGAAAFVDAARKAGAPDTNSVRTRARFRQLEPVFHRLYLNS